MIAMIFAPARIPLAVFFRSRQPHNRAERLLTISLTAVREGEKAMNEPSIHEHNFLIDLIFKPNEPGLRLPLEESQLLLVYIGEILREIEIEDKRMIAEQNAAQKKETTPCR